MQASDRVLAGRYAAALFQAAAAKSEEQKVQADLGAASKVLASHGAALRHPRLPASEKKKFLQAELGGKIGAATLKFLELLVDKKRVELFPLVAANFGRMAADK